MQDNTKTFPLSSNGPFIAFGRTTWKKKKKKSMNPFSAYAKSQSTLAIVGFKICPMPYYEKHAAGTSHKRSEFIEKPNFLILWSVI